MSPLTRRTALRGICVPGVALALAGCADETEPPDPSDDEDASDDDEGDDGDSDDEENGEEAPTIETLAVEPNRTGAAWSYQERRGICVLARKHADVAWLFEDDEEPTAFLEATDFEESILVYVESVGPNTCYRTLELADLAVEGERLVGRATAIDDSEEGEDVCSPSLTYPGALVRVTADPLPTDATFTITDGWGDSAEVSPDDGVLDADALPGFIRPAADPDPVPAALDCPDEDVERHYQGHDGDVSWGSGPGVDGNPGLELRVVTSGDDGDGEEDDEEEDGGNAEGNDKSSDPPTIGRGEAFRIELTNVSTSVVGRGNSGKYNLERYTEEGWTEIRVFDDEGPPVAYTDELIFQRPGETVTWEFEMTEEGLIEDGRHGDRLEVCPELGPGRYRFAFWGADDVAVAFDHEE